MLALIVPLRSLTTHPRRAPAPPAVESRGETVSVHVVLSSTQAPFHFEIAHLGKPVWTGDAAENEVEKDIEMRFPKEGVDLLVDGSWVDSGPAVLKVAVTPAEGDTVTKMLWGEKSVSNVLTFK